MTIADNYAPIRQIGDGVTTQFSASWSMIAAAYATVFLEDATTGVQTAVTQGAGANQYQIAITASGFTVTFGTAPTASQYAVIGRTVTKDQSTPYKTSRGFQGPVEEASFDKLTALVQQLSNQAGRNISAPLGDTANLQLPKASLRAGSFLTFDASGNVSVASGVTGTSISTAMTPIVQAASIASAMTLLGAAPLANPNFTGSAKFNSTPLFNKVLSQTLTTSGTYTPTAGMVSCTIEIQGAGGGSGGSTGAGSQSSVAGSGGGGGYLKISATAAQIGASSSYAIGAAGAAGASGNNAGGAGGSTTITIGGSTWTAGGGGGGGGQASSASVQVSGTAGAGGTNTTGSNATLIFGMAGQTGGLGISQGSNSFIQAPSGGSSFLGRGPNPTSTNTSASVGVGYGAGSSPGGNGSGGNIAGGAGTQGCIIITEYISA